jgi:hypothetical protein
MHESFFGGPNVPPLFVFSLIYSNRIVTAYGHPPESRCIAHNAMPGMMHASLEKLKTRVPKLVMHCMRAIHGDPNVRPGQAPGSLPLLVIF